MASVFLPGCMIVCVSHSWRAKHADAHIEGEANARIEGRASMHTLKEGLMHTLKGTQ